MFTQVSLLPFSFFFFPEAPADFAHSENGGKSISRGTNAAHCSHSVWTQSVRPCWSFHFLHRLKACMGLAEKLFGLMVTSFTLTYV